MWTIDRLRERQRNRSLADAFRPREQQTLRHAVMRDGRTQQLDHGLVTDNR